MTAAVIQLAAFGAAKAAPLARPLRPVQRKPRLDPDILADKVRRCLSWLEKNGVLWTGFRWSTVSGGVVSVEDSPRLRRLLGKQMVSTGHHQKAGMRPEHWEARDPITWVVIKWHEKRPEGQS
jgi:hypothetical protein